MFHGSVIDYLQWRGDVTLKASPFNDIDNLILAIFAYVKVDEIVPSVSDNTYITLEDCGKRFYEKYSMEELEGDKSLIANAHYVLKHMMRSERFKHAKLCKFVSQYDENNAMQFAAFHVQLDDNTTYITFRGTDDTIIGWKEDFDMSYKMPVPSQKKAVEYVNSTIPHGFRKYRFGGHSKGGNLAVFAAVNCNEYIKKRILHVYSNDGPGFLHGFIESEKYKAMSSRITTIVPESSIVGMLMEHEEDYIIVKSDEKGMMQHDALSWKLTGTNFITIEKRNIDSIIFDHAITSWLKEIDDERREKFIEATFTVIHKAGIRKLSEMNQLNIQTLNTILRSFSSLDSESKNLIIKIIFDLTHAYGKSVKDIIKNN